MKKLLSILLATLSISVFASDNWRSSDGALQWRNSDGTLCWRDTNWTPSTAAQGCDGWLAPKKPVATKPTVTQKTITLTADTLFDFDKYVIKPDGLIALNKLASQFGKNKLEVAIVVGHTDNIGSDAYNIELGQRRANAVKSYLMGQGFPASKIYTESKGKSNPVASNATEEGRAKNRRVDIEVVGN